MSVVTPKATLLFGADRCWLLSTLYAKTSRLGNLIGTTRSRVSHFMNKFREAGFIDYNGHLEVHSSLLSVVLAEQPRTVRSLQ